MDDEALGFFLAVANQHYISVEQSEGCQKDRLTIRLGVVAPVLCEVIHYGLLNRSHDDPPFER